MLYCIISDNELLVVNNQLFWIVNITNKTRNRVERIHGVNKLIGLDRQTKEIDVTSSTSIKIYEKKNVATVKHYIVIAKKAI